MYRLITKIRDEKLFSESWDDFISNEVVSLRYTRIFIEYLMAFSDDINDQSFVVVFQEEVVGIAFLPIEKFKKSKNSISINQDYIMCPIAKNDKAMKFIYEKIDLLARKYSVAKIMFQIDPLIQRHRIAHNPFTKFNFIKSSCNDYMIDLRISKKTFIQNMGTSHRKTIKKFKNNHDYDIKFFTANNITTKIFNEYKRAHYICAGRKTRPDSTFDVQYEMILNGLGCMLILEFENKKIGFLSAAMFQNTASFWSIANIPEYEEKVPIYKLLVLESFKYFKSKRYDYIHFGAPANDSLVGNFGNYCDKKQLQISKYKLDYNPIIVNRHRGIKYYDKEAFNHDLKVFKSKVMRTIE